MEALFWILTGIIVPLVIFKSFKFLGPDDGVEKYFFGHHVKTHLPWKFYESLTPEQQDKYTALGVTVTTNWFDLAFGLWPFYRLIRYSTSPTKVLLHTGEIFTKELKNHPRIKLGAEPALLIRFLTIRDAVLGVGFSFVDDLTIACEITGSGDIKYNDTLLARGIRDQIKDAVREAIRKTASEFYWHSGSATDHEDKTTPEENEREIVRSKRIWEKFVLYELSAPESVLAQSHITRRPKLLERIHPADEGFWEALEDCHVQDFFGSDILSLDTNISELDFASIDEKASAAQNAVNKRFVSIQDAAEIRLKGTAEADVIGRKRLAEGKAEAESAKLLQEQLEGADPSTIAALLLMRDKDVKINTVGLGIADVISSISKGKP
jgi:hypothetical protein